MVVYWLQHNVTASSSHGVNSL